MHTFKYFKKQATTGQVDVDYLLTYQFLDRGGFPPSYVDFASQLGWGRLSGLFLVYVPLGQYSDSWLVQSPKIKQYMNGFYKDIQHDTFLLEPDGYEGIEVSLVPFAMSENGQYLAWDTSKRDRSGEFPIYVLAARLGGIRYGAKDLYQFVEKYANDADVKTALGPGYNKLPLTFEPLPIST